MTSAKLFFRFSRLILPYRGKWFSILVLSGAGALMSLINPYLTKMAVDDGILGKDFKTVVVLALLGGGIFAATSLSGAAAQLLKKTVRLSVGFDLNKKVFDCLQRFSFGWFQARSTGENLYSVRHDIANVANFVTDSPPQMLALIPRALFITAIVFSLNWKMAMLAVGLSFFLYLPSFWMRKRLKLIWQYFNELSQKILIFLEETFSNMKVIKAFGRETSSTKKYLGLLLESMSVEMRNTKIALAQSVSAQGITLLANGLIGLYGGYLVIHGEMTLGALTAIMVYLRQLVGLHGNVVSLFQSTIEGLVSCRRVADILDDDSVVIEAADARPATFKRGTLAFRNVSFGYRPGDPAIKDVSFEIEGGGHIALVGPSGCGKTTILMMFLRMHEPWAGGVFIDGQNLKDLTFSSLRGGIGMALQEPLLWNDSIENNIRYGRQDATEEDVREAARLSGVEDFAKRLPRGCATVVGEGGCRLSEGQKQKIAIARVLIKQPKILILDEAMSSMDSASERRILKNIKERFRDSTVITVSHRLSAVEEMDVVCYFSNPDRMIIDGISEAIRTPRFIDLFAGQGEAPCDA
ncbi:MAG: ABC transporter ATP-binding protein [Pseudomonadota bacterium]